MCNGWRKKLFLVIHLCIGNNKTNYTRKEIVAYDRLDER